MVKLRIN